MPETGGSPEQRAEEAIRLMEIIDQELRTSKTVLFDVRAMEFLNETRNRLKRYGCKTLLSPKQLFFLRDLKDRAI